MSRFAVICCLVLSAALAGCGSVDGADNAAGATTTVAADVSTTTSEGPAPTTTATPTTSEPEGEGTIPAGPPVAEGAVRVTLGEFYVDLPDILPGGDVVLDVFNGGEFKHELKIIKADSYESLPQEANGAIIEDELDPDAIVLDIGRLDVGASTIETVPLDPGAYVFVCNISVGPNSHAGKGQYRNVSITG